MNFLDLQCFNNNETSSWEGCEKNLNVDQDQEIKAEDENENVGIIYSVDVFR